MFEKITKWFTSKAADGAVEGFKTSFNEKVDQYGDIIRIGLVLGVIVIGSRHISKRNHNRNAYIPAPGEPPLRLPSPGQPIVINNYYPGYLPQPTRINERREKRNVYCEQRKTR